MSHAEPTTVYLDDYRVPEFLIDSTELTFELHEAGSRVRSRLQMRRNPDSDAVDSPLVLDGVELQLLELKLDGEVLAEDRYQLSDEHLTITDLPAQFTLESVVQIEPQDNTSLEGLYKSRTMFCTQCEAEGFRKITYYLDRPDVMSVFTVTVEADQQRFPVLLSNGNLEEQGESGDGRHWTRWHDPHMKPAYLFALVAGDLEVLEDHFTTMNNREVTLRIYVEAKDLDKCDHAMDSLKRSMRWDEEVYGREYDLDLFNIVAVDDFNMGAMENKSLNIFNTSCVLAKPETTTDAGFQRVEAVVAHEYFHNWSGNRVTCRDWFQLSLKEGFTVFRDAQFSADMNSPTVKRVEDVNLLRTVQFAEDAGPMAHPVRPDSYMEISNFYTVTIYEKGAEVVRMLHELLGPEQFRRGSDLYFERHDGQAVTCDDFVKAMEAASGRDLTQFRRWYSQAGTPVVQVEGSYDAEQQRYHLTFRQSCPATPGQSEKAPFVIPVAMGLLGDAGSLPLQLAGAPLNTESSDNTSMVLEVTEAEQTFTFEKVLEEPVPSLLRGFSAPVKLRYNYSRDDLTFLISRDTDGFSRWNAAQQLGVSLLLEMVEVVKAGGEPELDACLIDAYRQVLSDPSLDKAMVALVLALPSEAYLAEESEQADAIAIHTAREAAKLAVARALESELLATYQSLCSSEPYQPTAEQIARRSLKNSCLSYLMQLGTPEMLELAQRQFREGDNMTDVSAALTLLAHSGFEAAKQQALDEFYQRWQDESLVVNQWFMLQASSPQSDALEKVEQLRQHPAFEITNPNKVRALVGGFCGQNPVNFHRADGAGYRFLADRVIELDALNPQIASRLLGPLTKWRRFVPAASQQMRGELARIAALPNLSKDLFEVVSKSLKD